VLCTYNFFLRHQREKYVLPIEGPYAALATRLGLATTILCHTADHYGQMALYLRLNAIVPPSSRPNPPKLQATY